MPVELRPDNIAEINRLHDCPQLSKAQRILGTNPNLFRVPTPITPEFIARGNRTRELIAAVFMGNGNPEIEAELSEMYPPVSEEESRARIRAAVAEIAAFDNLTPTQKFSEIAQASRTHAIAANAMRFLTSGLIVLPRADR